VIACKFAPIKYTDTHLIFIFIFYCLQIGADQVHGYASNCQMRDGRIVEVFVDQEEGQLKDAHGHAQAECPMEVFFSPHVPRQREPDLKFRV
jgi:hypothetical protein